VARLDRKDSRRDFLLEPRTDRIRVADNDLRQNGLEAHPGFVERWGSGADLIGDGSGRGNGFTPHAQATRAGVALAACEDGPAPLAAESGGSEPRAETAPQAAAPAATAPEVDHVIRIQGMRYQPKHLQIRPGETVRWVNEDAVPQTVTSSAGRDILRDPLDSSYLMRGDGYSFTFSEAGRYEYLCVPHMDQAPMREATVTVVE
jgi:plastocyanin